MTMEQILEIVAPMTGIGFLLGCIPMLMGMGIQTIINIFKKF